MGDAIVLHARLDSQSQPGSEQALFARLPYAKRLELEARPPSARRASLMGIALVLIGASRLYGREVGVDALRFPGGGKPFFPEGPPFSISHSERRVAAALSLDQDLGIDLEDLPSGPGARDTTLDALRRWTAREAVLKAAGRGLRDAARVELDAVCGTARLDGVVYYLRPLVVATDTVAHVAASSPLQSVSVERVGRPLAGRSPTRRPIRVRRAPRH